MECMSCWLESLNQKELNEWLFFLEMFPDNDFEICEECYEISLHYDT